MGHRARGGRDTITTLAGTGVLLGAVGVLGVLGVLVGVLAAPAHAEVTTPARRCLGTATFANGPDPSFTVATDTLQPDDVTTVRRADTVEWQGELIGLEPGRRAIAGAVHLDLPWPIPDARLGRWSTTTDRTDRQGTYTYSLPSITPRGVTFRLHGEHRESDAPWCRGSAKVRLAGSRFGALTLGGIALLALSVLLSLLVGRVGGRLLGAVTGALTLGLLGTTLVLLGIVPLASPVVTLLPVAGIPIGALWGRAAPLRP